ncbi:VC0807 family protein [Actinomycetota bacterium Odt1-20B]
MSQLATTTQAGPTATQATDHQAGTEQASRFESLKPLVLDAAVPMAMYYLLSNGLGMSTLSALAWSSVVPAGRTLWSLVKERRVNGFAALILTANIVGLLLSLLSGDARLMLAKDSGITGTIGLVVLGTVASGRPMMTAALKPWVTKGNAARDAAWGRLMAQGGRFARMERMFSVVWGGALLGEAVLRIVGAYTLPVDTMVWLGSVIAAVTITLAVFVSGGRLVDPMEKMVDREVAEIG